MPNSGILLVDKPTDMTSHDLVNIVRKVFHTKKVGHNGTLDPDATGVMVLCINQATRLNEYLVADEKFYRATIKFGQETDTQDISGEVTKKCEKPAVDIDGFKAVLASFIGVQDQTPPMYSAIKKDGKPLYKYAREGIDIGEIPKRQIEVLSIDCVSYTCDEAVIDVHCSKGTYIRTLCQDIARALGSCGCMAALRRMRVGAFEITSCHSVEAIKAAEFPYDLLLPMSQVVPFPKTVLSTELILKDLMTGKKIPFEGIALSEPKEGQLCQAIYQDELIAIGCYEDKMFVPKKVFHL